MESAIAEVRHVIQGEDLNAIRRATEDLQRASHAIAEHLYKQAAGGQSGSANGTAASGGVKEGEVVDAEYAETK